MFWNVYWALPLCFLFRSETNITQPSIQSNIRIRSIKYCTPKSPRLREINPHSSFSHGSQDLTDVRKSLFKHRACINQQVRVPKQLRVLRDRKTWSHKANGAVIKDSYNTVGGRISLLYRLLLKYAMKKWKWSVFWKVLFSCLAGQFGWISKTIVNLNEGHLGRISLTSWEEVGWGFLMFQLNKVNPQRF